MLFQNRTSTSKSLAQKLIKFQKQNPLIIALPRGGVPIAYKIAKILKYPLDILIVRKISEPKNPEFALGAITEKNISYIDRITSQAISITDKQIKNIVKKELLEIKRRQKAYRGSRKPYEAAGKTIILVDDGIATGATIKAAILTLQKQKAKEIIIATPIISSEAFNDLKSFGINEIIYLQKPDYLNSISSWYKDFKQVSDEEVISLMKASTQK